MPQMTPTPKKTVVFPPPLQAAIDAFCTEKEITFSQFIRQAAAEKIGQPLMADEVRPEGRPKKTVKAKPAKRR